MTRPLQAIVKTYPPRGRVQQFRLEAVISFVCFRCGQQKKSKLVTVYAEDWGQLLCNGCYGRLLSLYEVQAGASPDEEKAEKLAAILLELATEEQRQIALSRSAISLERTRWLREPTQRFLGTSEFVAGQLGTRPSFDWSPAVIGLCKAFECEIVCRLIEPLRDASVGHDLTADVQDKDLGRVARYCAGRSHSGPELGAVAHFLQTAANSRSRIASSTLLQRLKSLLAIWPRSLWLIDGSGAVADIGRLASQFRNRAAHVEELNPTDYAACLDLVAGPNGMLWKLVAASNESVR